MKKVLLLPTVFFIGVFHRVFFVFCKKSAGKVEKSYEIQGFSTVSTEFSTGDVQNVEKIGR